MYIFLFYLIALWLYLIFIYFIINTDKAYFHIYIYFPHHIATVPSALGREIYVINVIDSSVELLPLDCIPQEAVLGITIGEPFKRTLSLSS